MHHRTDDREDGRPRHEGGGQGRAWDHDREEGQGHRAREHDEAVFTTMAVGEEGDPDLHPDPAQPRGEPVVFTTMAVGEEGDPDLHPHPVRPPEEPVFTTMAVGEEGDPDAFPGAADPLEELGLTTLAVGEESDAGADDPWCA